MMDVHELFRRWTAGQSARKIARDTGADRKTVARYLAVATELGLARETEWTEATLHEIAQRVQARPLPAASDERQQFATHRPLIEAWLAQKRPLRLRKIHTLLVRDHGVSASYHTLRRFVIDELGWRKKQPTVLVADGKPGEEAQLDFGLMGTLHDPETGRARRLYALVVTLVVSRYQFVWPSFTQTTEAVCEGLDAAWRFFGAMARVLLPDNMTAIVSTADPLAPTIVAAFQDCLQARGIFVDPARVRAPKDKGRVENQVSFVRESWFEGETFTSLLDTRRSAEHWSREIAGTRVHGTTRLVPREAFERDEKPMMLAPPSTPFDVPHWTDAKVHPDHHVQVLRALYSVPSLYIGRTVRVRADRRSVRIYLGTEAIKTHPRVAAGKRSTDPSDYPTGKAEYALRSVEALLARAKARGTHVGLLAEKLLGGPLPWTRMRQAYALVRLCDTYGDGRVEAVCQSALAFDVVDVTRLARMLKAAVTPGSPEARSGKVVPITSPRFARTRENFPSTAITGSRLVAAVGANDMRAQSVGRRSRSCRRARPEV
jgi:transposase